MLAPLRDDTYADLSEDCPSQYDEGEAASFFSAAEPSSIADGKVTDLGKDLKLQVKDKNKVAIVLGYYDGEEYLSKQLESIFAQSHQALHVFISDDRSPTPLCANALNFEPEKLAKLSIGVRTKNVGFTNNFLKALAYINDSFEYFAFSDQDDFWYPNKLEKAVAKLSRAPTKLPALYCARTEIADTDCSRTLGYSIVFKKKASFANALVQNIGGGNTMVFNKTARDIIVASLGNSTVASHDWWCYQIITGAGGYVVYDQEPCLKYRQHNNNLVGASTSWAARLLRVRGLIRGHFRAWNDANLKALKEHKHLLTKNNVRVLNDFSEARESNLFKRLMLFKRSGIYRQTLFGNLGLLLGILLNRV